MEYCARNLQTETRFNNITLTFIHFFNNVYWELFISFMFFYGNQFSSISYIFFKYQNWKYLFNIKPPRICKIHKVMNLNIYFFTIVITWLNFKSVPNYFQCLLHICLNLIVFCLSCHVHLFCFKCVLG